jgi:hypothetical protein
MTPNPDTQSVPALHTCLILDGDDAIVALWQAQRILNQDGETIPADVVRRLLGRGDIIRL